MNVRTGAWLTVVAVMLGSVSGKRFEAHAQASQPVAQRAAEMRDHYAHAIAMHRAVIRGDLAEVAVSAETLTRYTGPPGMPDRAAAYATTIRQSATNAAAAANIVSAAVSSALMLNACGQCHQMVGARPNLSLRPPPQVGGIVGHMLDHQRAADQIFQGLILPSDSLWRDGTRAFATAPLHASDLPVDPLERRRIAPTEERLHRLASDAAQAIEPRARASYYGQLLAGCADCHSRSKRWGPGR